MKKSTLRLLYIALAGSALAGVSAQEPPKAPTKTPRADEPRQLILALFRVADTEPTQYLRIIHERGRGPAIYDTGFKSLGSPTLKRLLKNFPEGTTISWYSSCVQVGVPPSKQEFAEFKAYCQSIGLRFIIVPSS